VNQDGPSFLRFFSAPLLFLGGLAAGIFFFSGPIMGVFQTNPLFNTLIIGVWGMGMAVVFREKFTLFMQSKLFAHSKLSLLRHQKNFPYVQPLIQLCAQDQWIHGAILRDALQRVQTRMSVPLPRYLSGVLVFLGLLGTLWGLSQTIVMIADSMGNLPTEGATEAFFELLKDQLRKPLAGMGVAFSSSLFGVAGSMILGFFTLLMERSQEWFFQQCEDWAQGEFSSHASGIADGDEMAFLRVTLTQWMEGVDRLGQLNQRMESRQQDLHTILMGFSEKTQHLAEMMKAQHFVLNKWAEEQSQSRNTLERMGQKFQDMAFGGDETVKLYLNQLTIIGQEILKSNSHEEIIRVLRQEFRLLGKTLNAPPASTK
jgi:hypothetical protein